MNITLFLFLSMKYVLKLILELFSEIVRRLPYIKPTPLLCALEKRRTFGPSVRPAPFKTKTF